MIYARLDVSKFQLYLHLEFMYQMTQEGQKVNQLRGGAFPKQTACQARDFVKYVLAHHID